MPDRLRETVRSLLFLLSTVPAMAMALDTTVTLTVDDTITPTSGEVVTFGLPLAEGDVYSVTDISVVIDGVEQVISIEPGLTWHWSDSSLRSVTIQLQGIDMTGGDVTVAITDAGNTTPTRAFVPHSDGWATGSANKANMPFPRVFAIHDLDYLASTGIIPPFAPGSAEAGVGKLQSDQFDNGFGDLDFSVNGAGSQASYLFDRATAMMKAYMSTGDTKFLKEGFMTKQLYFNHIRNDGTPPANAGGDGCFTFGSVDCRDGKYIYTEPAKLAWALFGDNSQWDDELINEMAFQNDLGSYQARTRDPYDQESEPFTERAAGLAGLAEINAFEITGDETVLAHLNERIDSLKDMQQTEKSWDIANGWVPKSGAFTHSWCRHEWCEGGYRDGVTDDRRFSPWMSENIADFLWQAYHVTERSDIPEMLRLLGNAIELYGFTSSYASGLGLSSTYEAKPGLNTITLSCSAADPLPVSMLYSASAYASAEAIAETALPYTDQHNVEIILPLALAFYFESDASSRNRLYSRIKHLEHQWLVNSPDDCATLTMPPRLFNWQHRSNSLRTWDWVLAQVAGVFDENPTAFTFPEKSGVEPNTEITSDTVSVSGLGEGAVTTVSTDTGVLIINGAECTSDCSVQNGDTLAVRLTSAGTSRGSVTAWISAGSVISASFTAVTKTLALSYSGYVLVNSEPDCQSGQSWHWQCLGTDQWVPAAEYANYDLVATCGVPDGTTCLNAAGSKQWRSIAELSVETYLMNCTVRPTDISAHNSCPAANTRFITGSNTEARDTNPDPFTLAALTELVPGTTVTSDFVIISGLDSGVSLDASTDQGTLLIDGAECTSDCSVSNGQTLSVRLQSSPTYSSSLTANVSVGNYQTSFPVTTAAAPGTTPESFAFRSLIAQPANARVTSDPVIITGLGEGMEVPASADGGSLIVNGAECSNSCPVTNGDSVAVRLVTSGSPGTGTTASMTVGNFSTSFSAVTAGAPGEPLFWNTTASALDRAVEVTQHFWAGMPDTNGDGCFDLFSGTHADVQDDSALYLQNLDSDGCTGTFSYIPTTKSNYTQPSPVTPRITSRYIWGNFYGHPEGLWSFLGTDADGPPSARYEVADSSRPGEIPQYDAKRVGCPLSRMSCLPVELDGDGIVELATLVGRRSTDYFLGHIYDATSGELLLEPDPAGQALGMAQMVFDLDNDGYPEILFPANGGYWKYNPDTGKLDWKANKLAGELPDFLSADSHFLPLDYDADGDLDIYLGVATYNAATGPVQFAVKREEIFTLNFYRNNGDGTFTDVTDSTGLGVPDILKNTYYHSLYGNSVVADLNLDGYPDIIYGAEGRVAASDGSKTQVVLIMNNGDGTFTVNRDNQFGGFTSPDNSSGRPWINVGDYNNDGMIDLVKTHGMSSPNHESIALFENVSDLEGNDWMRVRVRGVGNNTDGLHTRLTFKEAGTDNVVTSYQVGVFGTPYQNLVTHAGLGDRATIKLEVAFPHDGPTYVFDNLSTNQDIVVLSDGTLLENYRPGSRIPLTAREMADYTDAAIQSQELNSSVDSTPTAFTFASQAGLPTNVTVTSNQILVSGLGADVTAEARVDSGTLIINGSDCLANCTVRNGDTLAVRLTTANTDGVGVTATVTIGASFTAQFDAFTAGTLDTVVELPSPESESVETVLVNSGWTSDVTVEAGQLMTNSGTLVDLTNYGTVSGGSLSGNIDNSVSGILSDVNLMGGTIVTGGTLTGSLTGLGTVRDALIDVTELSPFITLGEGIRISAATAANVVGLSLTDSLRDSRGVVQLEQKLLVTSDGAELSLADITAEEFNLYFANPSTSLSQNPETGIVRITNPALENTVIPLILRCVTTTDEPAMSWLKESGEMSIVRRGLKLTFAPTAADLNAFRAGLEAIRARADISADGRLLIQSREETSSERFDPFATFLDATERNRQLALDASAAVIREFGSTAEPGGMKRLVFYPDGLTQALIPVVHDLGSFRSAVEDLGHILAVDSLDDGIVNFTSWSERANSEITVWRGIPSRLLEPPVLLEGSRLIDASDRNGDSIPDYYFDTPNYRQVLYGLPLN